MEWLNKEEERIIIWLLTIIVSSWYRHITNTRPKEEQKLNLSIKSRNFFSWSPSPSFELRAKEDLNNWGDSCGISVFILLPWPARRVIYSRGIMANGEGRLCVTPNRVTEESRRNSYKFGLGLMDSSRYETERMKKRLHNDRAVLDREQSRRQMRNLIDGKHISNEVI